MASEDPTIQFEDVPIDEARRMGRGPRMDPHVYQALKTKIQALDGAAARLTLPEGASPTTMKNRLLRVAADAGVPLIIRRVPGGLLFWRSTEEGHCQVNGDLGKIRVASGMQMAFWSQNVAASGISAGHQRPKRPSQWRRF
jgi:hypothetical protein